MFDDDKDIIIEGKIFNRDMFSYLLNSFKEGFSHCSLTIEAAFSDLETLDLTIEQGKDEYACEYFDTLSSSQKREIMDIVRQIIVFKGSQIGVFFEKLVGGEHQINELYKKYFSYFDSYLPYYLKFDRFGNFDKIATFHNLEILFRTLPAKKVAYETAYNMKKDHLEAFDYAMRLNKITVPEIININNLVIKSDIDKVEGFKKTNNDIFSASFTPADKKDVPFEMQRLLSDYEKGFGKEILDPNEVGITSEERRNRIYKIFEREAIFHIRFERIHPFNDGNGRTGRIIMIHNLIEQGLAPAMVTNFTSSDYKKYINDYDVEGLTKMLVSSSSQQMVNWVSMSNAVVSNRKIQIHPDNSKLAELENFSQVGEKKKEKSKLLKKINEIKKF